MCVLRFVCWRAFEPFIATALLCVNKLCKKGVSGGVLKEGSHGDKFDKQLYAES